jgi:hypothetical protein
MEMYYKPQNRHELIQALRDRWPGIKCSKWSKARLWAVWFKMRGGVEREQANHCYESLPNHNANVG